jgi:meiotically up-regulated gene 157 (Mug157) protein
MSQYATHIAFIAKAVYLRAVQSLISLPYLGFLDKSDPAYVATRTLLLSRQNPYFAASQTFSGIGCVTL